MRRAWKFRLYPTDKQAIRLLDVLSVCQQLYNIALKDRRTLWKAHRKSTGFADQSKYLPLLKCEDEEMSRVNAQVLQDVLHRVDKAFAAFFRRVRAGIHPAGYPRFKAFHRYHSFTFPQYPRGAVLIETKKRHSILRLHRIGNLPIRLHHPVEGTVKTCSIVRDVDRWYAILVTEDGPAPKPVPIRNDAKAIGVDLGLTHLLTLSDGIIVEPPKLYREAERKLTRRQRRLSRSEKGSANRRKRRFAVAKAHQKVREQRRDFAHKLSRKLVDAHDFIAFEDLTIRNMVRSHRLSKSIADASWGQLVSLTASKAEGAGKTVVLVDPAGTSQECSGCGTTVPKPLSERTHSCPSCGLVVDRDLNAARNVLRRGWIDVLRTSHSGNPDGAGPSQIGREPAESKPVERRTAGRGIRSHGQVAPLKQETSQLAGR